MSGADIRAAFEKRYKHSKFSRDMIGHLAESGQTFPGFKDQVVEFIVDWDERNGYDGSPQMLNQAADALNREYEERERRGRASYNAVMSERQAVANGHNVNGQTANEYVMQPRPHQDYFGDNVDVRSVTLGQVDANRPTAWSGATRADAVDVVNNDISSAARQHVFRTPTDVTTSTVDGSVMSNERWLSRQFQNRVFKDDPNIDPNQIKGATTSVDNRAEQKVAPSKNKSNPSLLDRYSGTNVMLDMFS